MIDIRLPSILASLSIFATSSNISVTRFSRSLPASCRDISRPLNITVTFNLAPAEINFCALFNLVSRSWSPVLGLILISFSWITCCFFLFNFFCFCCSYRYLPKSRILHTGGSTFGEISTKSNPTSSALLRASFIETTPACFPLSSINLTFETLINSFTRGSFLSFAILYPPSCCYFFHNFRYQIINRFRS